MPVKKNRKASKSSSKLSNTSRLRNFNIVVGLLFLAQAVALPLLSDKNAGLRSVFSAFTAHDPTASLGADHPVFTQALRHLFDINLLYVVTLFLLIPAVIHLWIGIRGRRAYEANLNARVQPLRWVEFGLGGAALMLAVALVAGVYEFSNLLAVIILTMLLGLIAWRVESLHAQPERLDRSSLLIGGALGFLILAVFASYVVNAILYGNGLPEYVYYLLASTGLLALVGLVVAILHHRGRGRFASYIFTEWVFIALALVVKSAVAWQIFAGILR